MSRFHHNLSISTQSKDLDLSDLYISIDDLPKARRKGTNEMITSRGELIKRVKEKWIAILGKNATNITIPHKGEYSMATIIEGEGFMKHGSDYKSALLVTDIGIERFLDFINQRIIDIWEESREYEAPKEKYYPLPIKYNTTGQIEQGA